MDGGIRGALARAFGDPLARAGYADIVGPYGGGLVTENGVAAAFADALARWGGADECLYTTVTLPAGREASLEGCLAVGLRFAGKAFPGHQSLVAVHYDGRPEIHIVTCAVSFLDGADIGERMLPRDEQERLIKDLLARMPGAP